MANVSERPINDKILGSINTGSARDL